MSYRCNSVFKKYTRALSWTLSSGRCHWQSLGTDSFSRSLTPVVEKVTLAFVTILPHLHPSTYMQTGSDTDTDLDGETYLSSRSPSPSHSRLGLVDIDNASSLTDDGERQSVPDAIAVLQAIDVNLISADVSPRGHCINCLF